MTLRFRSMGDLETKWTASGGITRSSCDPDTAWEDGYFEFENISAPASNWWRRMYDHNIPNFYARSRAGEVIINSLHDLSCSFTGSPCTWTGSWDTDACSVERNGVCDLSGHMSDAPNLDDEVILSRFDFKDTASLATASAWANVDESEILALASLAEAPETIRWIQQLLYRAMKLFRDFRKLKKLKLSIDGLSDAWLELRYAFRPLVFDMVGALKALEKTISKSTRHTARGFSSASDSENYEGTHTVLEGYVRFNGTRIWSQESRAGVLYAIDEDVNGLMSVWVFDQTLESIWDLMPFSFIIDWFFNVGDIIAGWSANSKLSPLGSWCTTTYTFTEVVSATEMVSTNADWNYNKSGPTISSPGTAKRTWSYKHRKPMPTRPVFPSLDLNLNLGKITDLAAIGRNLAKL